MSFGLIVSNKGIEIDKAKVGVIEKLPPLTYVQGMRSFSRHVSFWLQFIKDCSKITKHLTQLLVKDVPFDFDKECLSDFIRLKEVLISNLIM